MQNQHRSSASMQDVAREPDVPTPKQGLSPRLALLIGAFTGAGLITAAAFLLLGVQSKPVESPPVQAAVAAEAVPVKTAEAGQPARDVSRNP